MFIAATAVGYFSLTTRCWKSHALITLVACFGKIPRFCRFEPELLEKFELKSSLFESISESASSELLQGDNWSAVKAARKKRNSHSNMNFDSGPFDERAMKQRVRAKIKKNNLLVNWSNGNGHPIWLSGVEPRICDDIMLACVGECCVSLWAVGMVSPALGCVDGGAVGMAPISLLYVVWSVGTELFEIDCM